MILLNYMVLQNFLKINLIVNHVLGNCNLFFLKSFEIIIIVNYCLFIYFDLFYQYLSYILISYFHLIILLLFYELNNFYISFNF